MAQLLAEGTGGRADVYLHLGGVWEAAGSWPAGHKAPDVELREGRPVAIGADATAAVAHDGETLGAIAVTKRRGEPLTATERALLDDIAGQAALVVRNVRLHEEVLRRLEELRSSRQRLVSAQNDERRRLERDLHDGAQQQLVAMKIKLNLAQAVAEEHDTPGIADVLRDLTVDASEAIDLLRALAHGLSPPRLAADGLEAALRSHVQKVPLPVTVVANNISRYPQDIESSVYFCVLENLQNVTKYAKAREVTVELDASDGMLHFAVVDDGVGFDAANHRPGQGLTNMVDRLDALGGSVTVDGRQGAGTTVRGKLPIPEAPSVPGASDWSHRLGDSSTDRDNDPASSVG